MNALLVPAHEDEAAEMVRAAAESGRSIAIAGGNTRSGFGNAIAPAPACSLRTAGLSGIVAYNPAEMVLTARAGTQIIEIEEALAENGQMMAFEPIDHRAIMGTMGEPTIGGAFATNASGPRRSTAGAARDSLLGVRFVNGRGEIVRAGGRVMKNVTGLDLVKLMAGSHGTLGLLTEVTFRVLPRPQTEATLVLSGLEDAEATRVMAAAMAMPVEVSGAAHLPESVRGKFIRSALPEGAATVLRLEGLAASVAVRLSKLDTVFGKIAPIQRLDADISGLLWREIRDVHPFADGTEKPVWRVSVPPSAGYQIVADLRQYAAIDAYYDWQGGLVWMRMEAEPEGEMIRHFVHAHGGGHATLVRASAVMRAETAAFEPQPSAVAALSARIKHQIDPAGIFAPGRMAGH